MATIPGNSLQQRLTKQKQFLKRPSTLGKTFLPVTIIEVYDADYLALNEISDEVRLRLAKEEGTLFARVKANASGRELVVPFYASEAQVLSTYGNGMVLKDSQATLVYAGLVPEEGRLEILGEPKQKLSTSAKLAVFDVVSFL